MTRRNILLISDEIYERITIRLHCHVSPLACPRSRPLLLSTAFPKTYAMTGWRLGYCAGAEGNHPGHGSCLAQASRDPPRSFRTPAPGRCADPRTASTRCAANMPRGARLYSNGWPALTVFAPAARRRVFLDGRHPGQGDSFKRRAPPPAERVWRSRRAWLRLRRRRGGNAARLVRQRR